MSKYLGTRSKKGLLKLGNILIPGNDQLPRFDQAQVHCHVDRVLDYIPAEDRSGLIFLLSLLSYFPSPILYLILYLCSKNEKFPSFLGAPLRLIEIGLKGLIYTLYYSGVDQADIFKTIGWDAKVINPEVEKFNQEKQQKPQGVHMKDIFNRAKKAQTSLKALSVKQRLQFIANLKEVILKEQNKIMDTLQKETKKSRSDALMSEIFSSLDHLAFLQKFAQKSLRDEKVYTPLALLGKKSQIFYEPMGTVLIIQPWNYPFHQAIVPITSAFICGNAVLYKPSEHTPMKGLVEELLEKSGFEKDWVQIIYGDGKVGQELIECRPDKILFTGSTATGKKIMEQASKHLIPVELELGGKDPMIVFEDVNIERTAKGALWGGLTNLGQSCTSVERLFVHESIYSNFKEQLQKDLKVLVQKIDQDGSADFGEMTCESQVKIVKEHLDDALSKGAKAINDYNWDGNSSKIPPIVLENITPEMKVYSEETFGPLIALMPFKDEAHAIALANDSVYGLSASVWSKDKKRATRVARALHTGNVSINNVMLTEGNAALPFGGVKNSGFGREKGVHGLHGLCNIKSVLVDNDSSKIEVNWYPYTEKKFSLFAQMTASLFKGGLISFIKFALTGLGLEGYSNKVGRKGRGVA